MLGTLIRAGDVLDLFTLAEPEWGVTATAQRLGIGKSLAHEALATLTEIGLLERVGHGRYRLGWRTVSLASVQMRTNALNVCARPIVRDLAESKRMTVNVAAWERGRIICVHRRNGGLPTAAGPRPGATAAPDDSAIARVLMAARPESEIRTLWSNGALQTTQATIEPLITELARIRRNGWAHDGGPRPGTVAAPIRDHDGRVMAAISLLPATPSGPADERHAPVAVAAAARISEAIRDTAATLLEPAVTG